MSQFAAKTEVPIERAMTSHPIPDAALDDHVAIVGKTGAGKSYATKTVIERQLGRGERVCVVDPTGVYWGLRLDASGKKASGFDIVILGGLHGYLPLEPEAGAAVAELIATTNMSVVLDLKLFTVGQRTRFFTAFAETLLRLNAGPGQVRAVDWLFEKKKRGRA